jgi:hypothetical protein
MISLCKQSKKTVAPSGNDEQEHDAKNIHDSDFNSPQIRTLVNSFSALECDPIVAPFEFLGKNEGWWLGGVLAPNKKIYYIPGGADQILCFDPENEIPELVGLDLSTIHPDPGQTKWASGCVLVDGGIIFAAPATATTILRVDTNSNDVNVFGAESELLDGIGIYKFMGCVLANDFIFMVPAEANKVVFFGPISSNAKEFKLRSIEIPEECRSLHGLKWTGGVVGLDGLIYCIPGTAHRLLCINPNMNSKTNEPSCCLVGDEILNTGCGRGEVKFCGGVRAEDGSIFGIPANSHYVLHINVVPSKFSSRVNITLMDMTDLGAGDKYFGGELGADGRIYCAPRNADQIMCINTGLSPTIQLIGPNFKDLKFGDDKFSGGFVMSSDRTTIYGYHKGKTALRIALPRVNINQVVSLKEVHDDPKMVGGQWYCSVRAPKNGCIYYLPMSAKQILRFDPKDETRTLIGPVLGEHRNWQWAGGAVLREGIRDGEEDIIYATPSGADQILVIRPHSHLDPKKEDKVSFIESLLLKQSQGLTLKWPCSVVTKEGVIFGIPAQANYVLKFDPRISTDDAIQTIEIPKECVTLRGHKWRGGVLGGDDKIYCIPGTSSKFLCIDPSTSKCELVGEEVPKEIKCGPMDPKFCGGVLLKDILYCVPLVSQFVMSFDISSKKIELLKGTEEKGKFKYDLGLGRKWEGAVLGSDGLIYCAPVQASHVLCINPATKDVFQIGPDLSKFGDQKFNGGLVEASDSVIYGIFHFNHNRILRIAPPPLKLSTSTNESTRFTFGRAQVDLGTLKFGLESQLYALHTLRFLALALAYARKQAVQSEEQVALVENALRQCGESAYSERALEELLKGIHKDRDLFLPVALTLTLLTYNKLTAEKLMTFCVDNETAFEHSIHIGVEIMLERAQTKPETFDEWFSPWFTRALHRDENGEKHQKDKKHSDALYTFIAELENRMSTLEPSKSIQKIIELIEPQMQVVLEHGLPYLLLLDKVTMEKMLKTKLIESFVNSFLNKPGSQLMKFLDGCFKFGLLFCFLAISSYIQQDKSPPYDLLVISLFFNCCNLVREVVQIVGMYIYGLKYFWLADFWNLLDVACIVFVFLTLVPLFKDHHENTGLFRILFSIAVMLVWLEVIAFVKTISLLLATFVLAFIQIIRDLVSFLVILVCFMLAFANVFSIILPVADDDQTGNGGPFSSFGDSFLTTYTMMLGGFNRWWFESSSVKVTNFSISAFVIFMFVVYIVLLNMLIAIVGDSYAFAMTKAPLLFAQTKCAVTVEYIVTGVVYLNILLSKLFFLFAKTPCAVYVDYIVTGVVHLFIKLSRCFYFDGSNYNDKIDENGQRVLEWQGVTLEIESRTKKIVKEDTGSVNKKMDKLDKKILDQFKEMDSSFLVRFREIDAKMLKMESQIEIMNSSIHSQFQDMESNIISHLRSVISMTSNSGSAEEREDVSAASTSNQSGTALSRVLTHPHKLPPL